MTRSTAAVKAGAEQQQPESSGDEEDDGVDLLFQDLTSLRYAWQEVAKETLGGKKGPRQGPKSGPGKEAAGSPGAVSLGMFSALGRGQQCRGSEGRARLGLGSAHGLARRCRRECWGELPRLLLPSFPLTA